jgi:hypothetical protein
MSAATAAGLYAERIAAADWDDVARDLDAYGCALLPRLLDPAECARIAGRFPVFRILPAARGTGGKPGQAGCSFRSPAHSVWKAPSASVRW